jgi:hypothetical protein
MSLYKYLEKILGKSSSYYEMLMNSKKENSIISSVQVDELVKTLKSISEPCSYYQMPFDSSDGTLPVSNQDKWPTDHKLNPLPLVGCFQTDQFDIELYVKRDQVIKNSRYQELRIHNRSKNNDEDQLKVIDDTQINLPQWNIVAGVSVPIWEEVVHRYPNINQSIKKTAPNNPWTLYKSAASKLNRPNYDLQLEGFPQWLINDVDFRKIKKLEFLLEFKLYENSSLFYFYDPDLKEVFLIKQKL